MRCPSCKTLSRMMTKNSIEWHGVTRRRKQCVRCGSRFNTIENFETNIDEQARQLRSEILNSIGLAIEKMRKEEKPILSVDNPDEPL